MTPTPLVVDVWSDIACPWCWVGRRHLQRALAQFSSPARVVWHAFELDPTAPHAAGPASGGGLVQRLADKYRASRADAQAMIDRMQQVGTTVGLAFRFDRVVPTNTFDAHRLLHWAASEHDRQDALKERLMLAYMHEGLCVSDHAVLVALAQDVGLPAEQAAAMLASDRYAVEVRNDEADAAQLGARGVPFFVIDERFAIAGAQPTSVLLQALQRAHDDRSVDPTAGDASLACGPDGCSVPLPE